MRLQTPFVLRRSLTAVALRDTEPFGFVGLRLSYTRRITEATTRVGAWPTTARQRLGPQSDFADTL